MMKKLAHKFIQQVLDKIPVLGQQSTILMLHRVGTYDSNSLPANQNMMITPEELDIFVASSVKNGWEFISLDELVFNIDNKKSIKKTLVLSFDDGYLDNFTSAFPVLSGWSVPFAIYITTGFIGNKVVPWWYKLEVILNELDEIKAMDGINLSLNGVEGKNNAFMLIRNKIMSDAFAAKKYYEWIDVNYEAKKNKDIRIFMNWDDVHQLSLSKLVTIGAHTHTHPILTQLDDVDAFNEMKCSKDILESYFNKEVKHFAFPFGGFSEASEREVNFAQDIGFSTAVTTRYGAIKIGGVVNNFELPRVFFAPGLNLRKLQSDLFVHEIKTTTKKYL
jgi:peptidoglycan/xylan/chitin deacetylase (PgdA/CDA1 family)